MSITNQHASAHSNSVTAREAVQRVVPRFQSVQSLLFHEFDLNNWQNLARLITRAIAASGLSHGTDLHQLTCQLDDSESLPQLGGTLHDE